MHAIGFPHTRMTFPCRVMVPALSCTYLHASPWHKFTQEEVTGTQKPNANALACLHFDDFACKCLTDFMGEGTHVLRWRQQPCNSPACRLLHIRVGDHITPVYACTCMPASGLPARQRGPCRFTTWPKAILSSSGAASAYDVLSNSCMPPN